MIGLDSMTQQGGLLIDMECLIVILIRYLNLSREKISCIANLFHYSLLSPGNFLLSC